MNELINVKNRIEVMNNEIANTNIYELYTNTLTSGTKLNYISTIRDFFGVKDLNEITPTMLRGVTSHTANLWASQQLEQGLAKSTINRKLSAMRSLYSFLCRRDVAIVEYNPFDKAEGSLRFKNAQRDYSDKRVLSPEEIKQMIALAKKDNSILGLRDTIIIQLLATTGMRRAELCGISLGDFQVVGDKITIRIVGKGDKRRLVVVTKGIMKLINEYVDIRGLTMKDSNEPLIASHSSNADVHAHVNTQTINRTVKKYAKAIGLDESTISCHCFRATFATLGYGELGYSADELRELMGHSSQSTTQMYIKTVRMLKNNPADELGKMFE